MSLPREWSIQDSWGTLHGTCGPTSPITEANNGFRYQCNEISESTNDATFKDVIGESFQTIRFNGTFLADGNSTGSMFSVHSAPPVPSGDLDNVQIENKLGLTSELNENTSAIRLQRPVSLAIDPTCIPYGSGNGYTNQTHLGSEPDEEDNENLLTISSLTARPLIAKSRELRSSKYASKRKQRECQSDSTEPPDGGYGWIIVFGAFSVQFWVTGLVKSFGVLYVEIMETFPYTSATVASWIPAILSALCLALAPLSSALCQRFSCRSVVFVGGVFCVLGLTLSYFATSLYHLLFTFGILTGIGGGLSTTPGIVIVSQYFDKHRALANGICVSGTAVGSIIFPKLFESLVNRFGFHGTILILGCCMLQVCISGLLYKPLELKENSTATSSFVSIPRESVGCLQTDSKLNTHSTFLSGSDDPLFNKFMDHLTLEQAKNKINETYIANQKSSIVEMDSEDECKDVVGETTFIKPVHKHRSSSILEHSVEDLSTDSTFMYKQRNNGLDSNRGSRRHNKNQSAEEIAQHKFGLIGTEKTTSVSLSTNRGLSKSMIIPTPVSDLSDLTNNNTKQLDDLTNTWCERIQRYLDITLLKDGTFIVMCLSVTLMSTGCPYMLYYLPAHVINNGYTKTEAGYFVAMSAALDLIGRLGLGWLSDMQLFDRKKVFIFCIFGAGASVLLIPYTDHWYLVTLSTAVYGLCLGSWYLLMPVLLADLFGVDRISSSYGLIRMFQSIGAISVPPLAGFLKDISGTYELCFYCMGVCMVCGSIILLTSNRFLTTIVDQDDEEAENSTVS